MATDPGDPRWREILNYFSLLPIDEKRCFFAKALKFFLESRFWNDPLRSPHPDDHQNMRHMLLAFSSHNFTVMNSKSSPDVRLQWQSVKPIKLGTKRRTRKKQISRLTRRYMKLIKQYHPTGRHAAHPYKDRVRCMAQFQKEFKSKFFS